MRAAPPPSRASARRASSLSRMSFITPCPAESGSKMHTTACSGAAGSVAGLVAGLASPPKPAYKRPMTEPPSAATLLQQGLFHHRQGQLGLAMDRYTDVLRNDPKNADALYYVAVVACQEGQYKQGAELARRAIEIGPPQARVHNLLGQAHDRLGEPLEAVKNYDQAIAIDPNFAEAHGNRAGILTDAGFPDEALKSYDRALALNPNSTVDWVNRGALLLGLGRMPEAIESCDRAIAIDAKSPIAYFGRANALKASKRLEDALAGYDGVIALDAKFAEAHLGRASVLEAMGRVEEARESKEKADAIKAQAQQASALPRESGDLVL
ncbi:MAG: tetratricopeptide repeat protein [Pseudolabrys sp.]|nr:tetratricopeptide repeat protein [Pseudolabrys sp.]